MKHLYSVRTALLSAVLAVLAICSVTLVLPHKAHAASASSYQICSKTYDAASLTTLTQTSTTITCPGVALGDYAVVSTSIDRALLTATAYVSAANTVTILVFNGSAGTIDLASATWSVRVSPRYVSP